MYSSQFCSINNVTIHKICSQSDARGGKVLSLLHDHITSYIGNENAQNLCLHLIQAASVPYMKMLGMWIYKGIISDPIKEVRNTNSYVWVFVNTINGF